MPTLLTAAPTSATRRILDPLTPAVVNSKTVALPDAGQSAHPTLKQTSSKWVGSDKETAGTKGGLIEAARCDQATCRVSLSSYDPEACQRATISTSISVSYTHLRNTAYLSHAQLDTYNPYHLSSRTRNASHAGNTAPRHSILPPSS